MKKGLLLFICVSFTACQVFRSKPPPPKTEFRGVWIATVANIDWPPSATDSWERQKEAYLEILDYYKALNFNTLIVQVRTAGDAFYPTDLAPWSRFLTGTEGTGPDTTEDPLRWMIDQTHQRGLEFHRGNRKSPA